ncbi:MAG TPA: hypothetical protein VGE40_13990 [Bacilli bacterium]
MISVGERIRESIDYMDQGRIEAALTPACIAIDITAQKYFSKPKTTKNDYKQFLVEHMWLITYMGLPGVVAESIKVRFSHKDIINDQDGYCTLEQIIYHVVRCNLVHSTGIDDRIVWNNHIVLGNDAEGRLIVSSKLIWGLIGAVVFCEANRDENINEMYWLSVHDFKFFINDVWGRIDIPRRILKMNGAFTI